MHALPFWIRGLVVVMNLKTGVLLLNLGTPDRPEAGSVRTYLRQFLSDPRVLDLPALGRWLLLNLFILPFRPKQSAAAYSQIWTDQGSPLKLHTQALATAVQDAFSGQLTVRYAMRYQNPSIESALKAFRDENTQKLVVVPLYPQYASSSTGSCLEEVYRICGSYWNVPSLTVVPPFYDHPAFRESLVTVAKQSLGDLRAYDFFLISFHGLPERHVTKCDPTGSHCLAKDDCCERMTEANRYCYRAQSVAAARNLAQGLGIPPEKVDFAFQSRLGRTPWIKPYTDEVLVDLAKRGVKRLAVLVPSFTADCLETLEEIAIRGKESFIAAGGESLHLVPSQNAEPSFVETVCQMIREQGLE